MSKKNNLISGLSHFMFVLLCAFCASVHADEAGEKLDIIGVQLYTLRNEAEKNLENVFNKITIMGYEQVELHSLYGISPGKMKLLLDKYRLDAYATHRSFKEIKDDPLALLADAEILKFKYVIVPWLDIKEYNTKGKWLEFSEQMNRLGMILRAHGLQLAYHNHDFEFSPLADGSVPYDVLIENTNPKYVALQLDLFWVTKAGKDPIAYLENNPGRYFSVHIKDMDKKGDMTSVGAGEIDFEKILKVGKKYGLKYFIVEHDNPDDAFKSVEKSIESLKKIRI